MKNVTNGCAFKTTNHSQGLSAFSEEEKIYTEVREKTAVNGTLQVHVERQQSKNSLRFADISGIGSEEKHSIL